MKRPLPSGTELAIFALVAVACAVAATLSGVHDIAMALFALPIFVMAAIMGMRRSGQWASIARAPLAEQGEALEEEAAV
jgi:hypothetical protein